MPGTMVNEGECEMHVVCSLCESLKDADQMHSYCDFLTPLLYPLAYVIDVISKEMN
jgi:hypothetical protein